MRKRSELKMEARREAAEGRLGMALELYDRAVRTAEEAGEAADPLLHVRIGDLHHRLGHSRSALASYRRAAGRYREEGLALNAVAVWERILRCYPDELEAHRSLVDLNLEQGLVAEARLHLMEYVEAADRLGRTEEAIDALVDFLAGWYDEEVAGILHAYEALQRRRTETSAPIQTELPAAEPAEAGPEASPQAIPTSPARRKHGGRDVRRRLPMLPSVATAAG